MAASVIAPDEQTPDSWAPQDDQAMGPVGSTEPGNGASLPADDRNAGQDSENRDYPRGSSVGDVSVSGSKGDSFREKQVKVLSVSSVRLLHSLSGSSLPLSGVWPPSILSSSQCLLPVCTGRLLLTSGLSFFCRLNCPGQLGVYFLLRSRTKSTLVVFLNTHVKRICKVALERLETSRI